MKVALVHDYIKEFGGAERVLKILAEIYPKAPIYTAFYVKNSTAGREFEGKEVKESFLAPLLKFGKLYSPLRFLAPVIWKSFDLSDHDLVITSASWYIARGFKVKDNTKVICYCHTPPRWLYGYEASVGFTKYWPVKIYSAIVGHFMRIFDYRSAQEIDYFVANSENVAARIKKFYRREAKVIYPPVEVEKIFKVSMSVKKKDYYLIVSRLVGAKGLEAAAKAAKRAGFRLKIVGEAHGFSDVAERLNKLSGGNIELLGRLEDRALYKTYAEAKGFLALARDEDFGITPVEAMAAGTPVIAYSGGGFKESIIDGKTGIFIDDRGAKTIKEAIEKLERIKWDKKALERQARKFSKERFVRETKQFVNSIVK
jgi:glycosyltransferase involved in cell wall biosynthesis